MPNSRRQLAPTQRPQASPKVDAAKGGVSAEFVLSEFLPDLSDPDDPKNPFWLSGYMNGFHNDTKQAFTVGARYWFIAPEDHPPQHTIGVGVGGKLLRVLPGESKFYISATPLPTAKGGKMYGRFHIVFDDGSDRLIEIGPFNLAPDNGLRRERQQPSGNKGTSPTLRCLNRYHDECAKPVAAIFDTHDLPKDVSWAFQRYFLGMSRVTAFNSIKSGAMAREDLRKVKGLLIDIDSRHAKPFIYTDMALTGDHLLGFSDLRVTFLNLNDTIDFLRKSGIEPADLPKAAKRLTEVLAEFRPAATTVEATATEWPKQTTEPTAPADTFEERLAAAAAETLARCAYTANRSIQRHREERLRIIIPAERFTDSADARAASRLVNNFKNLQKRLVAAGLKPLPPDPTVLAAQRLSRDFYR